MHLPEQSLLTSFLDRIEALEDLVKKLQSHIEQLEERERQRLWTEQGERAKNHKGQW